MFSVPPPSHRSTRSLQTCVATWLTRVILRSAVMAGSILVLGLIGIGHVAFAEEKDPQPEQAEQAKSVSKRRLAIMQDAIDAFAVSSKDIEAESALKFGNSPKLRYDDQVRNLLDAGVWRLGEQGRPTAFVTIELYGAGEGRALLTYEFVSLSPQQLAMTSSKGPHWSPASTDLKFVPLDKAPAPDASEKIRLTQMREIARRFLARQLYRGEKLELRLLTQPIDRYKDEEHNITDGAAFVYANGTNPELGMLIETDGKSWSYGLFRLSSAAVALEMDGKEVAGTPPNAAYGANRPYTATRHGVTLPE